MSEADNSNKIILDLCGGTGSWSKYYKDNGYDVRIVTLPDYDVRNYIPPKNVYGILAAPPCTMFSIARNDKTAKKPRDLEGGMEIVNELEKLLAELEQKDKRIQELEEETKRVLDLIFEYGQIDGGHHKMWVIDQIVRILTKDKYNEWIKDYVYDKETGDTYSWDKGIAP